MNDKIKNAFDGIHAEEQLKRNTLTFLQDRLKHENQRYRRTRFGRLAVLFVCFFMLAFSGLFSYNVYFSETMYVDIDINPSIELTVNRFGRVIGVNAHNADGDELLLQFDLIHKSFNEAVTTLTEAAIHNGFLPDGGLVSVTLQSEDTEKNSSVLKMLQKDIIGAVQSYRTSVQIDVFLVDSDTREHAHELNLSPSKYLAILELQVVDPTATLEGCRGHSISEIRMQIEQKGGRHHGDSATSTAPIENREGETDTTGRTGTDVKHRHRGNRLHGTGP